MVIGAYQFSGSGDIDRNFLKIKSAVQQAHSQGVDFLALHECALNGYPPIEVNADEIDFEKTDACLSEIKKLAIEYKINIAVGAVTKKSGEVYNSLNIFTKNGDTLPAYDKRALWGWDRDNFTAGNSNGIYLMDGLRIGVRICFEVRFPEYFRELYRQKVDLAVVSFCDISRDENVNRYHLIKSHLQTRAVENVMPILSVNNCAEFQTAPTAFFDKDGYITAECERNIEQLLVYDFSLREDDFGQMGRRYINSELVK